MWILLSINIHVYIYMFIESLEPSKNKVTRKTITPLLDGYIGDISTASTWKSFFCYFWKQRELLCCRFHKAGCRKSFLWWFTRKNSAGCTTTVGKCFQDTNKDNIQAGNSRGSFWISGFCETWLSVRLEDYTKRTSQYPSVYGLRGIVYAKHVQHECCNITTRGRNRGR